ncbi:hypothetical protein [Calycomorphotria hydatis]|nr:hypothetical protein [Calycomorphotria hydatis]
MRPLLKFSTFAVCLICLIAIGCSQGRPPAPEQKPPVLTDYTTALQAAAELGEGGSGLDGIVDAVEAEKEKNPDMYKKLLPLAQQIRGTSNKEEVKRLSKEILKIANLPAK